MTATCGECKHWRPFNGEREDHYDSEYGVSLAKGSCQVQINQGGLSYKWERDGLCGVEIIIKKPAFEARKDPS